MKIHNIMIEDDFSKEYLITYNKDYICYHCVHYKRCQDLKDIYKEKTVHCIGYINDEEIFDELIDEVTHMSDEDFQLLSEEADIFLNKEKEIYQKDK
jgi:hypothetical protein